MHFWLMQFAPDTRRAKWHVWVQQDEEKKKKKEEGNGRILGGSVGRQQIARDEKRDQGVWLAFEGRWNDTTEEIFSNFPRVDSQCKRDDALARRFPLLAS